MWKWQLKNQMDQSLSMQDSLSGVEEGETFKVCAELSSDNSCLHVVQRMLLETSPYLLALTFAVSVLRSVFDFLAFKNGLCLQVY